jgi:hypothetical protein
MNFLKKYPTVRFFLLRSFPLPLIATVTAPTSWSFAARFVRRRFSVTAISCQSTILQRAGSNSRETKWVFSEVFTILPVVKIGRACKLFQIFSKLITQE